jgi:AcrR family transcriptional regulator
VAARAGVPQSAFYEFFQSSEDCFLAAFEEGLGRLSEAVAVAVAEAAGRKQHWLERVRAGLVALLGFFDDEPGWGRLLVFQAPLEDAVALRAQQRVLGVLTALMDDGSPQAIAEIMPEPHLTAELVVGGVFSVIRAHVLEASGGALVELAPYLMSFIVGPYLGQAAARAELTGRPVAAGQAPSPAALSATPPPVPFSSRSALVLRAIACAPRSSNREIAQAAGLSDEGQTSHLLRRLAQRGLIEKVTPRSGSRRENAWLLTPCGRRVVELLSGGGTGAPDAPASMSVRQAA